METWWFTYHRIDKFDTVILRGVVACGDHDTDCSIALLRTKTCNHADGKHDMVKPSRTMCWHVSTRAVVFWCSDYAGGTGS